MGGKGVGVASGEQIVAAADVDMNHAAGSIKKIKDGFADAKIYSDYRKLFDEQKQLDAVWVATPDREKLSYDFRAGKFTNSDKANALLKREPRKGWEFGYA